MGEEGGVRENRIENSDYIQRYKAIVLLETFAM